MGSGPGKEEGVSGLALVYSDLGDNRKAAELLKNLTDKNPSARGLHALAAAYEQMREFDLAAQALQKELDLNPANEREVKGNLAQDLAFGNRYDAALKIYEHMAPDDPPYANAYLRLSH